MSVADCSHRKPLGDPLSPRLGRDDQRPSSLRTRPGTLVIREMDTGELWRPRAPLPQPGSLGIAIRKNRASYVLTAFEIIIRIANEPPRKRSRAIPSPGLRKAGTNWGQGRGRRPHSPRLPLPSVPVGRGRSPPASKQSTSLPHRQLENAGGPPRDMISRHHSSLCWSSRLLGVLLS